MTGMACKCFMLISNWFLMPTRTSTPLIDHHRHVIAHLIGHPADDPTWGSVNDEASRALKYTHGKLVFSAKDKVHRRELFQLSPMESPMEVVKPNLACYVIPRKTKTSSKAWWRTKRSSGFRGLSMASYFLCLPLPHSQCFFDRSLCNLGPKSVCLLC